MKRIVVIGLLFVSITGGLISCQSDADQKDKERREMAENMDPTSVEFHETEYNFGTVKEGKKVEHTYTFTNTGENPLLIATAKASCGCTVPQVPEKPISPGEDGEIKVVFDSEGRGGADVNKSIRVTANTRPSVNQLYLKGKVKKAE